MRVIFMSGAEPACAKASEPTPASAGVSRNGKKSLRFISHPFDRYLSKVIPHEALTGPENLRGKWCKVHAAAPLGFTRLAAMGKPESMAEKNREKR
jgi:hypothetical protein